MYLYESPITVDQVKLTHLLLRECFGWRVIAPARLWGIHQKIVFHAKTQVESSILAAHKGLTWDKLLASKVNDSYSQDQHCCLLFDRFGGQKFTIPSHLKAKPGRFSDNDGIHILCAFHEAQSSRHLDREDMLTNARKISDLIFIGGLPTMFAITKSVWR